MFKNKPIKTAKAKLVLKPQTVKTKIIKTNKIFEFAKKPKFEKMPWTNRTKKSEIIK